jgi:hypothetical protein
MITQYPTVPHKRDLQEIKIPVGNLKMTTIIHYKQAKAEFEKAFSDNTHIMNLDGTAKGVYMVLLQHSDNISKAKLVVE